jgi:hypothetical protein
MDITVREDEGGEAQVEQRADLVLLVDEEQEGEAGTSQRS